MKSVYLQGGREKMRRERRNRHTKLTKRDLKMISTSLWIQKNGYVLMQYFIASIFIWFGLLKLTGTAQVDLFMELFSSYIPLKILMPSFGVLEILIGMSMLKNNWILFSIKLLLVYMPITLLPFVLAPEQCYIDFPFILSLEGKSIISHLALMSGAIVLGGRLHIKIIELKV